jgi:hypothetical protein
LKIINNYCLLFILLLAGCTEHHPVVTGTYKSVPYGRVRATYEHFFGSLSGFWCGTRVIINPDSTFLYRRDPWLARGTWRRDGDSLVLRFTGCHYTSDSIRDKFKMYYIRPYADTARKYYIGKDYLLHYIRLPNGKKIIEKLKIES